MAALPGNTNARRGDHPRVQVAFSGTQLNAIYSVLGLPSHANEPEKVRVSVQKFVHDAIWQLGTARCFNGEKCHTGARELPTNEMVWCEIGKHYGWYCQLCYEVDHSPKSEGRDAIAMYKEQQQKMSETGETMKDTLITIRTGDTDILYGALEDEADCEILGYESGHDGISAYRDYTVQGTISDDTKRYIATFALNGAFIEMENE